MPQPTLTPLTRFSTLKFSGEKTQTFLQGQVTCDMNALSHHGAHSLAAICDHRGRMIANFWVVKWHNDFLFILPKNMASLVADHLKKYAVFSKVIISHADNFFIAEFNNFSDEKNPAAVYITLPSKNRYLVVAEQNLFPLFEINFDEILWKKNNINDQLCILYPETSLLFTPQMISLEKWGGVSFTKGCYVGQEIVARTQYLGTLKRHLHYLEISSDQALSPGDNLNNKQGEVIGVITEAAAIDLNKYKILAVIQDHAAMSG